MHRRRGGFHIRLFASAAGASPRPTKYQYNVADIVVGGDVLDAPLVNYRCINCVTVGQGLAPAVLIMAKTINLSCLRRQTFLCLKEKYAKEPNQRASPLETLRLKHVAIGCSDRKTRRMPNNCYAVVTAIS